MDGTGDHQVKRSKPGSERHVFCHMWKLDLKDKRIHDHIYIERGNIFIIGGGRRRKENDRVNKI
jgi:ribosomal protein S4E